MMTKRSDNHAERICSVVEDPGLHQAKTPDLAIARSWSRCIGNYELLPDTSHSHKVVEASELKQRKERLGSILTIARAQCGILYNEIANSGYAVILTDYEGVIVYYVSDPTLDKSFRSAGLWDGADWSEECEGTNGIGTSLREGRPITVHRDDHFHTYNTILSCSGVPIYDALGQHIAVLDVSSVNCRDSRNTQNHTSALVRMSARQIENNYFLDHFKDDTVIRFHTQPEYVGLVAEGLLAIDEAGKILGANANAIVLLGCKDRAELQNQGMDSLFDLSAESLAERTSRFSHAAWPVNNLSNGQRYFCHVNRPAARDTRPVTGKTQSIIEDSVRDKPASRSALAIPPRRQDSICCMNLDDLIGCDPHMAYNVRCARRVANKSVTILLCGETGTGKEAFAHAIHNASERASKPFVAVNCAAIPESLIESELFGYKHGAFTGAKREGMQGNIQQSNGGTLFLDEIGDMPPQLQTRLLRVLEEKEVRPLGSQVSIPIDLHVMSATNANLKELVECGKFREDLYYRLNAIVLTLPALRDRSDLEKLLRCILTMENDTGETLGIEPSAYKLLLDYHWPGNIRELRNVLRTAMALSDDRIIRLADLPVEIVNPEPRRHQTAALVSRSAIAVIPESDDEPEEHATPLECAEKEAIVEELERNHWSVTSTAKQLNISRSTLYRKAKKYGIPVSQIK